MLQLLEGENKSVPESVGDIETKKAVQSWTCKRCHQVLYPYDGISPKMLKIFQMNHGKACPARAVAGSAVATEQASQRQIISVDIVTLKAKLFDAILDDIHKVDSLVLVRDRWDMIAWMLRIIEG